MTGISTDVKIRGNFITETTTTDMDSSSMRQPAFLPPAQIRGVTYDTDSSSMRNVCSQGPAVKL